MNCMAVALDPITNQFTQERSNVFGCPKGYSKRCRLQSLTNLDFDFLDLNSKQTNLLASHSFNHRSVSTPCFSESTDGDFKSSPSPPCIEILGGQRVPTVRALVAEVTIAMVSGGAQPLLLPSGLGGAYLLGEKGKSIAVAKPVDEEPLAFNNPKRSSGGLMLGQQGTKRSIRVGETGVRELAAYLLDHQGFSGVPPTALVRISHVPFHVRDSDQAAYKVASLQRFVGHDYDAGELGPGSFTVASVHRIGILDVRVLNLDRHAGNMLVKKIHDKEESTYVGGSELVPIDHGICLPECLEDPYFEWLNWPQASVPFSESELQYISNLDPFKDALLLRSELNSMQESSLRVLIVCTIFLKEAAAAGLCLAEIGEKMTRDMESCSVLEILCNKAKASVVMDSDDDDSNEQWNEVEAEIECAILQFEEDEEVPEKLHVPIYQKAPSMAANLSALMRSLPNQWVTTTTNTYENSNREERSIVRSKSHPICVNHEETEGVYFGDMSSDEWEMFLESFQMLLPEALEEDSTSKGPKPRFGSSCKFF